MKISSETKQKIIQLLAELGELHGKKVNVITFLGLTWDLEKEPSTEDRFDNLKEQINAHYNDYKDWSGIDIYLNHLSLKEVSDELFVKFLNNYLSPSIRKNDYEIKDSLGKINEILKEDAVMLRKKDKSLPKSYVLESLEQGVEGKVRCIVFASQYKPEFVIQDVPNLEVKIINNNGCLVYEHEVSDKGLTWGDLLTWWKEKNRDIDASELDTNLLARLQRSIKNDKSPGELTFFDCYYEEFEHLGNKLPVLLPQVWLHFDPKTQKELDEAKQEKNLVRQRMDFLMFLSNTTRLVFEIDGIQHYGEEDKDEKDPLKKSYKASPKKYAEMVKEDRRLKLSGYQVYRFGGDEFSDNQKPKKMIKDFFNRIFKNNKIV